MARTLKLHVHVGKDHVVKLPSDFPEGLAEILVTPMNAASTGSDALGLWSEVGEAEYESFHNAVLHLRGTDQCAPAGR